MEFAGGTQRSAHLRRGRARRPCTTAGLPRHSAGPLHRAASPRIQRENRNVLPLIHPAPAAAGARSPASHRARALAPQACAGPDQTRTRAAGVTRQAAGTELATHPSHRVFFTVTAGKGPVCGVCCRGGAMKGT
jgi:hypothetical protein